MELGINETFVQIFKQGPLPAFGTAYLRECDSVGARKAEDAGHSWFCPYCSLLKSSSGCHKTIQM